MFRFIPPKGNVIVAPSFVTVPASGTIRRGSVVDFSRTNKRVEPSSSSSTYTTIFGISLDFVEGASDAKVRIVPFASGQLWEADCANITHTGQLMIKHGLSDFGFINNTAVDQSVATGVFLAYGLGSTVYASLSSTTMKLIGEFIRSPVGWGGSSNAPGYY